MNNASFWQLYSEAVLTSLSFFWKALWAFIRFFSVVIDNSRMITKFCIGESSTRRDRNWRKWVFFIIALITIPVFWAGTQFFSIG